MNTLSTKPPTSFWVISILLLLWNLLGVSSFFLHVITLNNHEALQLLPENEQALYAEYPLWTVIVFGLAVFSALIANILLLAKKKAAKPLFIVSLLAIIVQMSHNLFMTSVTDVYGGQAYIMPIVLIIIAIFAIVYTKNCIQKGWLH